MPLSRFYNSLGNQNWRIDSRPKQLNIANSLYIVNSVCCRVQKPQPIPISLLSSFLCFFFFLFSYFYLFSFFFFLSVNFTSNARPRADWHACMSSWGSTLINKRWFLKQSNEGSEPTWPQAHHGYSIMGIAGLSPRRSSRLCVRKTWLTIRVRF